MFTRRVVGVLVALAAIASATGKMLREVNPSKGVVVEDSEQQALLICLKLSDDEWGSEADYERMDWFEETLQQVVSARGIGEVDGMDRGLGLLTFYLYGPSADSLFDATIETIQEYPPRPGSYVIKQYGEPGAEETRIDL